MQSTRKTTRADHSRTPFLFPFSIAYRSPLLSGLNSLRPFRDWTVRLQRKVCQVSAMDDVHTKRD